MNLYPYIKTRALRAWAYSHRKQIKDWVLFVVLIILLVYVFNTDYQSCLGGGYTC